MSCGRWLRRLAAVLLLAGGALQAAEPLPFADETGLVHGTLRYSHLVKRLGEPPAAQVLNGNRQREGALLVGYPELGLAFRIDGRERPQADPVVEAMIVRQPWVSANPRSFTNDWRSSTTAPPPALWQVQHGDDAPGLHVGMDEAALAQEVARHYRVDKDYRDARHGGGSLWLAGLGRGSQRTVWVSLDERRVVALEFSTADPPWLGDSARKGLGYVAIIAVLLAVGWGWAKLRERLPARWRRAPPDEDEDDDGADASGSPLRYAGAAFALLGAAALGAFGWALLSGSEPYGRLLGLVMLPGALGLVLVALLLVAGSPDRRVAWPAKLLLGLLLAGYLLSKAIGR